MYYIINSVHSKYQPNTVYENGFATHWNRVLFNVRWLALDCFHAMRYWLIYIADQRAVRVVIHAYGRLAVGRLVPVRLGMSEALASSGKCDLLRSVTNITQFRLTENSERNSEDHGEIARNAPSTLAKFNSGQTLVEQTHDPTGLEIDANFD